ncbi:somatostatin receptor type 2 [Eurosta solidaginis]|uniref:somatostatin receptor type 2 n=1 Tax=Eurosta solidaginis TaxID=178769 RepID=UPI003530D88D
MDANKSNLFYFSLLSSLMPQRSHSENSDTSESHVRHEQISSNLAMARARALANIQEQFLPNLNIFQLEASEFLSRVNGAFFNMTYNETYEDEMMCHNGQNAISNLITVILYIFVFIVGLAGNTLVIYVVLRFSKMQTVTNIYILNLAIADECFLIGIPVLLYTMQVGSWQFDDYICKAYMVSTSITQFTSSIFLLIMSADRYIAVCHPISSPRYRTPFVSKVVSLIAWLTSVLLMLPVILFASTVHTGEHHISCNIKWPEAQNTQSGTTFILYSLTLGFAIPLTFILCFYFLVIRKLRTVGPKQKSKEKKRSHRKVTKLVLTVITVYILCWLPYWISQVALINSSPSECASRLEITIFLIAGCFGYSNSAMNPILYAFLSDNFKKSFCKACTCTARKDINAQLQMENSFFPRFGKKIKTDRLISSKKMKQQQKALAKRSNNPKDMLSTASTTTTTTTTTTNTTTGTSNSSGNAFSACSNFNITANKITPCTDSNTNTVPKIKVPVITHQNSVSNNATNIEHTRFPQDISYTEVLAEVLTDKLSKKLDGSEINNCKMPVLHTDL